MRVSRRVHKDKWKQMAGLVEAPTPRPGTPAPFLLRNRPRFRSMHVTMPAEKLQLFQ